MHLQRQRQHARWVGILLLAAACAGCGGSEANPAFGNPAQVIERRLDGTWKLGSYVPESEMSPVLAMAMQSGAILVRFDGGHLRSSTPGLVFDRRFRVADAAGESFKVFVRDEVGVEVESWCRFDEAGRLNFYTQTPPWRGRGVLDRQGPPPLLP